MVLPAQRWIRQGVLVLTADECLSRFKAAVRDGRRGSYALAQQLVEGVRTRHGEQAAQIAKRELWKYIGSDKAA